MKQTISLLNMTFQEGVGAIIFDNPDGEVVVEQQAGGMACRHPRAFTNNEILIIKTFNGLEDHFFEVYSDWCNDGIKPETADFIDQGMKASIKDFRVNRERLNDCMEAWIYCFVGNRPAVLTWENCD